MKNGKPDSGVITRKSQLPACSPSGREDEREPADEVGLNVKTVECKLLKPAIPCTALLLWEDVNHNGISEAAELRPARQRFTAIGLGYRPHNHRDGNGNLFKFRGWADIRTGDMTPGRCDIFDVFFMSREIIALALAGDATPLGVASPTGSSPASVCDRACRGEPLNR